MSDPVSDIEIDLPKAIAVYLKFKEVKAAMPPNAQATDWAVAAGCPVGSLGYMLVDLISTIIGQTKKTP